MRSVQPRSFPGVLDRPAEQWVKVLLILDEAAAERILHPVVTYFKAVTGAAGADLFKSFSAPVEPFHRENEDLLNTLSHGQQRWENRSSSQLVSHAYRI